MAESGCLVSLPGSIFFPTKTLASSSLSLHSKPIKSRQFSCSISLPYSSSCFSISNINKNTHFSSSIAFVAKDTTALLKEEEEEEEEMGDLNWGYQDSQVAGDADDTAGDEEYSEASDDAKVFVGNLPYDVDSMKLSHLFQQAGVVEVSEVIYNRETDQSRGFGFVTMRTVEEAEKAVDMFNRHDINGRLLIVNKAAPRGKRPERQPRVLEPANMIYVGNLPYDVDDGRLEQLFSKHGTVLNARVVYDKESSRSRGFGFVTMSTKSEVNDAVANLNEQIFSGRAIRVNVALERIPRSF